MAIHDSAQLEGLRAVVLKGGAPKYHEQNATQGKLFCRERIARLVDPGTFVEDGFWANQQAGDLPWRLALRVHHPSADLSDVAKRVGDAFGVEARWLWRAGDVDSHAKPAGKLKPTS